MEKEPQLDLPAPDEKRLPEHATPPSFRQGQSVENNGYQLRTLLAWNAPGRPFQKRSKQYYLNILIVAFLVEVILLFFSQFALMFLVMSLVFLTFVLAAVPPHDFHYKITTEGIMVEDHFFLWEELYDFYFRRQNGEDVLILGTKAWYPGELTIVLGQMHKEQVRDILLMFLPFREYVKPTFTDKAALWLQKNFPMEKEKKDTHHSSQQKVKA